MDSKGKKISLILITGIMTVLPFVGRTDCFGYFLILVAVSAVMLCVNILNQKKIDTSIKLKH